MAKDDLGQNTIGLTRTAASNLESVMESGWFSTEADACRVAMCVALERGTYASDSEMSGRTTKFNQGTFDRDGRVRQIISVFGQPDGVSVYDYAERLIHSGLKVMADGLSADGALFSDILALPKAQSPRGGSDAGTAQE